MLRRQRSATRPMQLQVQVLPQDRNSVVSAVSGLSLFFFLILMHFKEPTHGLRTTHPQPTLFQIHPTLPHSHGIIIIIKYLFRSKTRHSKSQHKVWTHTRLQGIFRENIHAERCWETGWKTQLCRKTNQNPPQVMNPGNHRAVAASAARDCTHWRLGADMV
jgi:hypothetical protein